MNLDRRDCITLGLASSVAGATRLLAQQVDPKVEAPAKPVRPEPQRGARQDLDLVKAFVQAGHSDKNLDRVKEYLSENPKLIYASWDWGGGDWETALGGAGHTGSREMARFLLSKGARIDSYCAAMLGEREVIAALVRATPSVVTARGPHGYTLLYHAAISGDLAIADLLKPHVEPLPGIYNQALTAAVRDGHLAMTKWLFANANINPNIEDALGKRPLTTALEKGFQEVAEELRKHGARESE
jgi:Ankyrin repeats (3 copies)